MAQPLYHLLVVDDDNRLRNLLERYLSEKGYLVTTAENAEQARNVLATEDINLVVLDVMMPDETGLEFLKGLRSDDSSPDQRLPILLLTALDGVNDRIKGLEAGADDYLTKPFEPKELLLRLENILRRGQSLLDSRWVSIGSYDFDFKSATLKKGKDVIYLTTTEQRLLEIFVANPGKILTRQELADKLEMVLSPRTIDVQITRLRRKLEQDPKQPLYIRTVRHKGYAFWPGD
tara:strand:+ start:2687 stop:3385 length:699 start_codon:yes stop_codon:yes gene_type:complete